MEVPLLIHYSKLSLQNSSTVYDGYVSSHSDITLQRSHEQRQTPSLKEATQSASPVWLAQLDYA